MVTRYRVLVGSVRSEITADEAHEDWDSTPETERTGRRDGAFILWLTDEHDCRVAGVVYQPITAESDTATIQLGGSCTTSTPAPSRAPQS